VKRYKIEISQNGWEYTGYAWIDCNSIKKISDDSVLIDGIYTLKFDEEIKEPIESNDNDEEYSFEGTVYK
jgi:hypothetical protein